MYVSFQLLDILVTENIDMIKEDRDVEYLLLIKYKLHICNFLCI